MNILYLTHQYFPRYIGGTEVYLKGLVDHARANGHCVKIITCHENPANDPDDFYTKRAEYDGVEVLEIHFNLSVTPNPTKWEYNNPFTAQVVKEEIASFQPDLVHVMHSMKLSGSVLEACDVPFIVTLCDFWFICPNHTLLRWNQTLCNGPRHPFDCYKCTKELHGECSPFSLAGRQRYLTKQLKKAKKIIALSPFQKEMFVKNGFSDEMIEVIPHGLDISGLKKKTPKKIQTIGFIGSLAPFKGVQILIEAIKRSSIDIECHIYGKGKLVTDDPRIQFCGTFPEEQLGGILETFDVLALPALWYENEPLVIKAALHMGIPVLASNLGSLPNMVTDGVNGWLLPPGDALAWSEKLEELAPLEFEPLATKSIEENGDEILTLYERYALLPEPA